MDHNKILSDIYNDFFNSNLSTEDSEFKVEKKDDVIFEDVDFKEEVEELLISDESKELLNKIFSYMEKYKNNEVANFIPFNISLVSDDKVLVEEVTNLIARCSKYYNYTDNYNVGKLSFYKLEKEEDITNIYSNGIVSLENIDAIEMKDTNFKKKFFYLLMEELTEKSITIISGKEETIKSFLLNDNRLEKELFIFKLEGVKPAVNDVYNAVLDKIQVLKLEEEFNVKILDYITNTYPKYESDYNSYLDNLIKYISFNMDVPKLEEVKSNEEVFKELNELVGLKKVKDTLNDLVDLITLKNKTQDDLKINNVNLHMVFLGNPGTGKTTVARLISKILYNLKYIKQDKLVEVSSKDLVAEYVGQTAVKTMNVIDKAMGGILFIDEAYSLSVKNNENSYNAECIATLIKAMEDYRDNLVVIFAGYTKEMQDFLDSNSGIVSRIGYTMEFDDYTNDELKEIFRGMVTKAGFALEEDALEEVERLINENRDMKNFGNARFVRNVFERTVINHASNTKNNKSKKILKTITKKDIKY